MPQAGNCAYDLIYATFTSDVPNDATADFTRVACNFGAFLGGARYDTYFREIPADATGARSLFLLALILGTPPSSSPRYLRVESERKSKG